MLSLFLAMKVCNLTWSLEKQPIATDLNNTSHGSSLFNGLLGPNSMQSHAAFRKSESDHLLFSGAKPTTPSVIVVQYPLGRRFKQEVAPQSFWRTQFYMSSAEFVKFNFSVPNSGIIGVYGRKNAQPTHVQYDFFHVFDGNKIRLMEGGRSKRAIQVNDIAPKVPGLVEALSHFLNGVILCCFSELLLLQRSKSG